MEEEKIINQEQTGAEEPQKEKKSKKGLIIAIIIILLLALAATAYVLIHFGRVDPDVVLVKEINACMEKAEAMSGKADTVLEALENSESYGYIIPRIKLSKPYTRQIIWDSTTNRYLIYDLDNLIYAPKKKEVGDIYQQWCFKDNIPDSSERLVYGNDKECIEEQKYKDKYGQEQVKTIPHEFHSYVVTVAGGVKTYTCEYCEHSYSVK